MFVLGIQQIQGPRSRGAGWHVPPNISKIIELVRKSVFFPPPNIEALMFPPPPPPQSQSCSAVPEIHSFTLDWHTRWTGTHVGLAHTLDWHTRLSMHSRQASSCHARCFRAKLDVFLFTWVVKWFSLTQTPSTLHRFQTKTILFCSGYGYRPHYNGPKTDRFENALQSGTIWKRYCLKTLFS